jgi:hypothetical protein
MIDRSDLIRQANDLKERAEHETDETLRERLMRMVHHYQHLAESQTWSEAHPADAAALGDVFVKGE